jgi:serine/threonine protein phosphatase PrpC
VFSKIDEEYGAYCMKNCIEKGGSTATTAIIDKKSKKLIVSSVGDSVAFIVRNSEALNLTNDQIPERIDEYSRVEKKGGCIMKSGGKLRVDGTLRVTRSIGDFKYKAYVTSEPEVVSIGICPQDQYLIISSDGLMNVSLFHLTSN